MGIFEKKNLQTGGKFKPKSSQFFQSVSRKHKLIYVSFFIKIGQWSTKKNVLKLLVVATLDPCLGWLTSHNFPAPKTSRINSSDPKRSCNLSQYISRHFACDVSRQRLNLMLDNVLVLSHCNRVHNII